MGLNNNMGSNSLESSFMSNADYTAQGIGGIGDIGLGIYNVVQGTRAAKQAKADLATALGNRPDLSPSTAFADAERNAYSKKMLNMQRQSLQRNLASGIQAASADPRALAASLSGMQRGAAVAEQQAMGAQAQMQMQATLRRGAAEQQSTQMMENRSQADIARESQNLASAQQAIGTGIGQSFSGLGSLAGGMAGGGFGKAAAGIFGAEKGAKVPKTPGKFSHESNPIDIVRGGAKVGEMTGGEYILNPKQASDIKSVVASGDKAKLHSYMKSLIKKFEK
jgi:hypothetical protein